ncbi:MAG: alpha/beta hydrolase [Pseudomonadota bacterium]
MTPWRPGERLDLKIGNDRLEAACHGPPPEAADTIVLLHEGLGCVALWRDFPARLAEATGKGVFLWSRAGYGRSTPCALPRPLDYMETEAREGLPRILDAIGFRKGLLLGHSDGASIAALYLRSHADYRVRGLILIAPHFFTEATGLAEVARARTAFETGDLRQRLARYHADPDAAFRGWNDAWLDPDFRAWDITDSLHHIRVPVLAVQGRDDPYGTRAQTETLIERVQSPVETSLPRECGHAPHLEQPDATLAEIAAFTARLDRIEG